MTGPISIHPNNPRYFLYNGKPRVLLTATEHYGAVLNRNFNVITYLNEAADKHVTLSRCFLLFRELEGVPWNPHSPCKPIPYEYLAPFVRSGPGYATDGFLRFDLNSWDAEYFQRLHNFLQEASRREIIVELTLFSNAYGDLVWDLNPFNAKNNINGIGNIDWQDYNSMHEASLFEKQNAYVRKIVQEVNAYDNLYFEICNEPFGDHPDHVHVSEVEAWQTAVRTTIRDEEKHLPKQHMIFQVPVERPRGEGVLDHLFSDTTISAINLHDYQKLSYNGVALQPMNQFMQRDLHLERITYFWTTCVTAGKPIIFDEDNAATNSLDEEGWTIHRKRAWTTVCSGGHYDMIDFSIQSGGQEAGTPASRAHIRTWIKHLALFIEGVDFIHTMPNRGFCTQVPPNTIACTLANPAKEYVIYIADKRERDERGHGETCHGTVAFTLPPGIYLLRHYTPSSGSYSDQSTSLNGGDVEIAISPFIQDTVIHIKATQ